MSDIIAKAFLADGETQRLIPTGPGRSVQFRSGGATVTDERDMPTLLMTPGITVEVLPEWADKYPSWLNEFTPYPRCNVQGVADFLQVLPLEPQPETVTTSYPDDGTTVYINPDGMEIKPRVRKPKAAKSLYGPKEDKPYSPKGRKLNLSAEEKQARSDRARKNFQKQPVEA